ncbi:Cu+-exporting ATPase [Bisgaardia hudsonensis]|uniref:Copper-exporting P-type ATPase n=1 Tax=Bisgaardia hudsonensis TaxID=109472 RepID=A0A4R2N197_9PAST|nr:copper-translocating P-type ATPase [Bisgaardia hudsonensis]TCP13332.1 Cu+-exporting ATPase [Bisgaardia hudsonensis]
MIKTDPVVVEPLKDQIVLLLGGLSCSACVMKVQKALESVEKVNLVQINLAESTALIDGNNVEADKLIQAVIDSGYQAELIENEQTRREKQQILIKNEIDKRKWQGIIALVAGAALMFWGLFIDTMEVNTNNQLNWGFIGIVILIVMIITGGHFYQKALQNIRHKTTTMDTLVSLGTGTAWLYSMFVVINPDFFPENTRHLYFEAGVMIIGLINIGKMLELKGKQQSSRALEHLIDLVPKKARIVEQGVEREIALSEVQQGMLLRLQTGDRVSVDGRLTEGHLWIDESMLTGEPLPVEKNIGDRISAGTLISDGTGVFIAEKIGSQTHLANIIKLVRQAQGTKPQISKLVDRVTLIFVPAIIAIAILACLIWYFIGPEPKISYALVTFTTVLIIACPCALGLATPMSIIAGVGRAAELGVLVRDADALEKAATADTIVFDKTGTLTKSIPKITALYCFNGFTEEQVLQLSASLEQGANHPLAKAMLDCAKDKDIPLLPLSQLHILKGLGVSGVIAEKSLLLGNPILMQKNAVPINLAEADFIRESEQGATVVFLAVEQQLAAVFVIRDPLKDDTVVALQRLRKQGYQLVMLTGDQQKTAKAIAREAGIDQVIAGVLPEGKAAAIKALQLKGHKVVMVGDGINDSPALAQADVGIAMGSGSDIAIETAELTLMRSSIHSVADALLLSKGILNNIRQNLFGAFIYNILGIPIAAGVLYPLLNILLNPMIGAAAMALSSITVVLNANRLLTFSVKEKV